jgi:hypothetical protein
MVEEAREVHWIVTSEILAVIIGRIEGRSDDDHTPNCNCLRSIGQEKMIVCAVTAGAFLLVVWVATKALFFFLQEARIP